MRNQLFNYPRRLNRTVKNMVKEVGKKARRRSFLPTDRPLSGYLYKVGRCSGRMVNTNEGNRWRSRGRPRTVVAIVVIATMPKTIIAATKALLRELPTDVLPRVIVTDALALLGELQEKKS